VVSSLVTAFAKNLSYSRLLLWESDALQSHRMAPADIRRSDSQSVGHCLHRPRSRNVVVVTGTWIGSCVRLRTKPHDDSDHIRKKRITGRLSETESIANRSLAAINRYARVRARRSCRRTISSNAVRSPLKARETISAVVSASPSWRDIQSWLVLSSIRATFHRVILRMLQIRVVFLTADDADEAAYAEVTGRAPCPSFRSRWWPMAPSNT